MYGALTCMGEYMTSAKVVEVVDKDRVFYRNSGGGVTISGGEPLGQSDFLEELLDILKQRRVHRALDTAGQMAMRLLPQPIIQIVDPDTGQDVGPGEAGEVVVTNFSQAYPLIRFGTGALAVNMDPNPGQSKQEERAVILVGRRGEAVKVRGMFVHPNQIRFALMQVGVVTGFQGIVTRPDTRDHLTVRIATEEAPADPGEREVLDEKFKESIRNVCRVRVDEIQFVEPGAIPADAPGMVDERQWG